MLAIFGIPIGTYRLRYPLETILAPVIPTPLEGLRFEYVRKGKHHVGRKTETAVTAHAEKGLLPSLRTQVSVLVLDESLVPPALRPHTALQVTDH